jgi:SAM-dependent methyltransferase
MRDVLTWRGDRFDLGGTTFQSMPTEAFTTGANVREGDFFVFKPRSLVERYVALVGELKPKRILELGIFQGGSTVFFAELARPRRIVAIDLEPLPRIRDRVQGHATQLGLGDAVQTYGGVDQGDRRRLAELVEDSFEGDSLDLVVDDCSHLYGPTRASFNELFPRLRPGGAYVIEDWRWAHSELGSEHPEGLYPDEVPLTRLLFEIVLATPAVPGLITDISIDVEAIIVRRGEAKVEPATFDVAECSQPRGRALLASP